MWGKSIVLSVTFQDLDDRIELALRVTPGTYPRVLIPEEEESLSLSYSFHSRICSKARYRTFASVRGQPFFHIRFCRLSPTLIQPIGLILRLVFLARIASSGGSAYALKLSLLEARNLLKLPVLNPYACPINKRNPGKTASTFFPLVDRSCK